MSTDFPIWPWEQGEKPFFVSEADDLEWYIDKSTTEWAHRENNLGIRLPHIVAFITRLIKNGEPVERVLMDKRDNTVIYSSTNWENVACHIDMLKVQQQFKTGDE